MISLQRYTLDGIVVCISGLLQVEEAFPQTLDQLLLVYGHAATSAVSELFSEAAKVSERLKTERRIHREAVRRRRANHMNRTNAECGDCGGSPWPAFVVLDELWLAVCEKPELLCLSCFEKRLGRDVFLSDLKECEITRTMRLGVELYRRQRGISTVPTIEEDE